MENKKRCPKCDRVLRVQYVTCICRHEKRNRLWARQTLVRHKQRGCPKDITIDKLVELAENSVNCPICGRPLYWAERGGKGTFSDSPTLVIIDDKMVIICNRCFRRRQNAEK